MFVSIIVFILIFYVLLLTAESPPESKEDAEFWNAMGERIRKRDNY